MSADPQKNRNLIWRVVESEPVLILPMTEVSCQIVLLHTGGRLGDFPRPVRGQPLRNMKEAVAFLTTWRVVHDKDKDSWMVNERFMETSSSLATWMRKRNDQLISDSVPRRELQGMIRDNEFAINEYLGLV